MHPQISDFQILSYHKPYINGKRNYFRYQMYKSLNNNNNKKRITGFVIQGNKNTQVSRFYKDMLNESDFTCDYPI